MEEWKKEQETLERPAQDEDVEALKIQLRKKEEALKKREKKLRRRVLLLILLLLLLLGGCGAWFWDREKDNGGIEREVAAQTGLLPGMSPEEIQDRLNRRVAESRLNVSINTEPVFANGRAEGDIRIENIPGNNYSFVVTLTVTDASDNEGAKNHIGEVIMKTGLIDPNTYVDQKALDVNLPRGAYTCTADFTAYKEVEQEDGSMELEEQGATGVQIIVTVLDTVD